MADKKGIVIFGICFVLVFSIFLVIAAGCLAPTDLIFSLNTTSLYDADGDFYLNWTDGGGNTALNYTIYLSIDGGTTWYNTTESNNSILGYSFSNTTNANYTFMVFGINSSDEGGANSSLISMYVDTAAPTITLPEYTNATRKKNTDTLTLNISVVDAAGLVGTTCVVDINGTNQSFSSTSGWCNTTLGNLTSLADGNNTITIWANDSAGNVIKNNTYVVEIDTTAPVLVFSCTPNPVTQNNAVACTCTSTDGTAGVATTTYTAAPSTANTGTYTETCISTDNTGNRATTTTTYDVTGVNNNGGSSSGGGSSTATSWSAGTHTINEDTFKTGFTYGLKSNQRIRFTSGGASHHVGVKSLTATTATIEIASTPQTATMSVGDVRKFEITGDDYYDLLVTLNSITDGKADVTISPISELITAEAEAEQQAQEESATPIVSDETGEGLGTTWIIGIIIAILIIAIGAGVVIKKRK